MKLLRISIGRLMLVILFIALASVAMLRPTRLTAGLAFSTTVLLLILGTLAVVLDRQRYRGFTEGFVIGGWLIFAVHFCNIFAILSPGSFNSTCNPPILPTTMLLDLLYPRMIEGSYQPTQITISMPTAIPFIPVGPIGATTSTAAAPPAVPATTVNITGPSPMFMPPPPVEASSSFWVEIDRGITPMVPARSASFMTIGLSVFTLILASLCGFAGSWLRSRQAAELPHVVP